MADEATATAALLSAGRYVKIHGLASEKARQHNGKTAVIKKPLDEATGRCCIQTVGGPSKKILAIKPSNLTILCSLCKMREEKTEPERIICLRCKKTSYCSEVCKEKHWRGANPQSDMPNCHVAWCIPIQLEMEPPTQAVGDSNVGEEAFDYLQRYLKLACDIGKDGRKNEERVMLEKLIRVDVNQPGAWLNLFHCDRILAAMAERYYPDACEEIELRAMSALTMCCCIMCTSLVPGETLPGTGGGRIEAPAELPPGVPPHEGQTDFLMNFLIETIHQRGVPFAEGCMRNRQGANDEVVKEVHKLLTGIKILFRRVKIFKQREESPHIVYSMLGFCCMKLLKYSEAVEQFELCRDSSKKVGDMDIYLASLMQIPLSMSSVAMYSDDKAPRERADLMEQAVSKSNDTIEVMKAKDPSRVYMCQAKLARMLFDQNSLLNQLAMQGGIEYSQEDKSEVRAAMSNMCIGCSVWGCGGRGCIVVTSNAKLAQYAFSVVPIKHWVQMRRG
ncbi:hypothetical protein ACHAXT_006762 [Thalassiosira profunda]